MRTTGIFETAVRRIPLKGFKDPFILIPFGDVHKYSPLHCAKAWKKDLARWKANPNMWGLGMGDYFDFASTSERKALRNADLHEGTDSMFDSMAKEHADKFVEEIWFMKDRLLGLVEGNHYAEFADGTTSTMYMAEKLGVPYLGCFCIVQLRFEIDSVRANYDIVAYHGKGAARLVGGSLNAVQYMAESIEADLYLMGHDHKKPASPADRIVPYYNRKTNQLDLHHRTIHFARTGGYLRAFVKGMPSYIADAGNGALPLGGIEISIKPSRPRNDVGLKKIHLDVRVTI